MARELRLDRSCIDPGQSFLSYGMDSVQAMTMVGDIETMLPSNSRRPWPGIIPTSTPCRSTLRTD